VEGKFICESLKLVSNTKENHAKLLFLSRIRVFEIFKILSRSRFFEFGVIFFQDFVILPYFSIRYVCSRARQKIYIQIPQSRIDELLFQEATTKISAPNSK
jgi:hypothetical protein